MIFRGSKGVMKYLTFLFIIFFCNTFIFSQDMKNINNNYYVYLTSAVPYNEINKYYKTGIKTKNISKIPDINTLKSNNGKILLLDYLEGGGLPRFTFVTFEIQVEDSIEAYTIAQNIPNSEIIYDEMGYQQYSWAIRSNTITSKKLADSLCVALKVKLTSQSLCIKNENTAYIIFGENLSKQSATTLLDKLKKIGLNTSIGTFKYLDMDL